MPRCIYQELYLYSNLCILNGGYSHKRLKAYSADCCSAHICA